MQTSRSTPIRGIDFESAGTLEALVASLKSTGFQASHLGHAIDLVDSWIGRGVPVYLSFTGNVVSSGLREVVTFLTRHRYVAALVTTAAGVEEDVIKSLGAFALDRAQGTGGHVPGGDEYRIGNIVAPGTLYAAFGNFLRPILEAAHRRQRNGARPMTPSELVREIGLSIEDESSFAGWAARNGVPVYCPGITDGAIGDTLVEYSEQQPGLCIDVVADHRRIVRQVGAHEGEVAALVLGGGIAKHHLLNASFFRGGFGAVVRISTALQADGSDSGGNRDELVSWKKLRRDGGYASVFGEATLVFPLLVAATFAADYHARRRRQEAARQPECAGPGQRR
jgi:deoxyhypusine synthase